MITVLESVESALELVAQSVLTCFTSVERLTSSEFKEDIFSRREDISLFKLLNIAKISGEEEEIGWATEGRDGWGGAKGLGRESGEW